MEGLHSVVVVGAGWSGLKAAQELKQQFPDVLVVEAQDRVGGRVKQIHGLAGWPVESGAEFIHGSQSALMDLVRAQGKTCEEKDWPDWWFFGREKKLMRNEEVGEHVEKVHELFANVGDEPHPAPGRDVSCEAWLRAQGADDLMVEVAECCYANDFGCSVRQLGLREMIEENRRWDSGETYLVMEPSMGELTEVLAKGLNIKTRWPVRKVERTGAGVLLHGPDGRQIGCRAVILTVPLAVLQREAITFSPPLPRDKVAAMHRVQMGNAIKVVLSVREPFWPCDLYDVVCTHSFIPEFWMLTHRVTDPMNSSRVITGFVAGERATAIAKMNPLEVVDKFVAQLDDIFGTPDLPHPARQALVGAQVCDWSKEEYAGGAYTYPSYGAELGDRDKLAGPVDDVIFFAGEATHSSINPCLQGALESGLRAAKEVGLALSRRRSRL